MLNTLKYTAKFSNGSERAADVAFDAGMTAITGPNESGKSMILEMIRFSLFGSKALRGKMDDYDSVEVECSLQIRGQGYTIDRNLRNATLYRDGEKAATGTKPVNAKIIETLGFDLTVFDVASCASQGEIEKLSTMKPTERKEMVDRTIGLDLLDKVADHASEEAATHRAAAEAIENVVSIPVEPEAPEERKPSSELREERDLIRAEVDELSSIKGWMSARASDSEPQPPTKEFEGSLEELEAHEERRSTAEARRNEIEGFLRSFGPYRLKADEIGDMEARHAARDLWRKRQDYYSSRSEPEYERATLEGYRDQISENNQAADREKLEKEKSDLIARQSVECPECSHSFVPDASPVDELSARIEELSGATRRSVPLTEREITVELAKLDQWEKEAPLRESFENIIEEPSEPPLTRDQLDEARKTLAHLDEIKTMEKELRSLPSLDDRREDLFKARSYKKELETYETAKERWDEYVSAKKEKEERMQEIKDAPVRLHKIEQSLEANVAYENAMQAYEKQCEEYEQRRSEIDHHREQEKQYKNARKAIRLLKSKIKSHLVPSLNKVASRLLDRMTNGARKEIKVDEEFDILVDSQRLDTLSGSGKAIANLAIRIGLGQVLTHSVFSVFMGDEVDKDMDDERATATADCLSRLTTIIGQVVLVTHKAINAEHYITLGKPSDYHTTDQGDDQGRVAA